MVNGLGGLPQIDRAGFPGQRWEPAATVLFFGVTAEPVLRLVAGLLARHRLDAVLIGNAAAALRGSPVTTVDLDFMFRKTPAPDLGSVLRRSSIRQWLPLPPLPIVTFSF
jgi:hypothetical protein